jgi:hypothetical protein
MKEPSVPPGAARPKRGRLRRWLRRLGFLILALILLFLGATVWHRAVGGKRLADALAAADRLDPGWRWEELAGHRAAVPDDQNAATVVLEAAGLLPESWPPEPTAESPRAADVMLLERVRASESVVPLDAELVEALRANLQRAQPALRAAHRLAGFRTGRYPDLSFKEYFQSGKVAHLERCRQVASLLWMDALLRTHDGRAGAALESSRCLVIAVRSLGDEPGGQAFLCRHHFVCFRAVPSIERALAHGQPGEKDLAATQELLADEQAQNTLVMALRGDRAFQDRVMTWIDTQDLEAFGPTLSDVESVTVARDHPWLVAGCDWFLVGWHKENHAVMLELMNEAVQIAQLPVEEHGEVFTQLNLRSRTIRAEEWIPYRYGPGCMMMPVVMKLGEAFARSRAELRCAATALAAERFRLAHGHWPATLDELTPRFLPAVPLDPFDGKPLRLRRFDDGLLIYSVGLDGMDDGGKVDRKSSAWKGQDLGFRLWDVRHRGREARRPAWTTPGPSSVRIFCPEQHID